MALNATQSKELVDLVKKIGESRSKQEEDKIIITESIMLKNKFQQSKISDHKLYYMLIRAIYVEMLGHDASFSHIHAVNMTQSNNLLCKRLGYLTSTLFLDSDNEILILLCCTLQKDLQSPNYLEVLPALQTISKIANSQIMEACLDAVIKLLKHSNDYVRKKAVMVMYKFWKISPAMIDNVDALFKAALCDKVPAVMGASLNYWMEATAAQPDKYRELAGSFVVILKQIIEHKLPREYDYHRMPAPWLQMRLLEILASLGADHEEASSQMFEIIKQTLKRAEDTGINIGHALVYQCLKTILAISPNPELLEQTSKAISTFFTSTSKNLRYIGVTALAMIVRIDMKYASQHQDVVVECLEDPDDTLKMTTLDLLYRMTNHSNVEAIVEKMLQNLKQAPLESKIRSDLVSKIHLLVEKHSPNKTYMVKTMNKLFEMGGDLIKTDIANKFIKVISEYEKEIDSTKFREQTVKIYRKVLEKNQNISDSHMQIIAWILAENLTQSDSDPQKAEEMLGLLVDALNRQFTSSLVRAWILSAITKIHMVIGFKPIGKVDKAIESMKGSKDIEIAQRWKEYHQMKASYTLPLQQMLLNSYASIEVSSTTMDFDLPFLDDFVKDQEVNYGAKKFDEKKKKAVIRSTGVMDSQPKDLHFGAYETPTIGATIKPNANLPQSNPMFVKEEAKSNEPTLNVGNQGGGWSKQGFAGKKQPKPTTQVGTTNPQQQPAPLPNDPNPKNEAEAPPKPVVKEQPKPVDKKKKKLQNALFAGITNKDSDDDSSDDDSDSDEEKPQKKPESAPIDDLLSMGPPASIDPLESKPDITGIDLLSGPQVVQQPAPVPQQMPQVQTQDQLLEGIGGPEPTKSDDLIKPDPFSDLLGQLSKPSPAPTPAPSSQIFSYMAMTTAQFGQQWGSLEQQQQIQLISQKCQTPQQYFDIMKSLNLNTIEIIQNEAICAGIAQTQQVLVHCTINPGGSLVITLKGQDKAVLQLVAQEITVNVS